MLLTNLTFGPLPIPTGLGQFSCFLVLFLRTGRSSPRSACVPSPACVLGTDLQKWGSPSAAGHGRSSSMSPSHMTRCGLFPPSPFLPVPEPSCGRRDAGMVAGHRALPSPWCRPGPGRTLTRGAHTVESMFSLSPEGDDSRSCYFDKIAVRGFPGAGELSQPPRGPS